MGHGYEKALTKIVETQAGVAEGYAEAHCTHLDSGVEELEGGGLRFFK